MGGNKWCPRELYFQIPKLVLQVSVESEKTMDAFRFSPLFCSLHITDLSFKKEEGVKMLLCRHGYGYCCRDRLFNTCIYFQHI